MMAKILVADDDYEFLVSLRDLLKHKGHTVDQAVNGDLAFELLNTEHYDLCILDWNMPGRSGVDLAQWLSSSDKPVMVLLLTARGGITDKVQGFTAGADDYLDKTADSRELLARIGALLKRPRERQPCKLTVRDLVLDPGTCEIWKRGALVKLKPREFRLIQHFMRYPNRVFNTDELLRHAWSMDSDVTPHSVVSCINKIRNTLDDPDAPSYIRTIYSIGYVMEDAEHAGR